MILIPPSHLSQMHVPCLELTHYSAQAVQMQKLHNDSITPRQERKEVGCMWAQSRQILVMVYGLQLYLVTAEAG